LKLQVASVGKPKQVNLTACLKPFSGVTVSDSFPDAPAVTLNELLLTASE
jgi:hypothetical protein